MIIGKDIDSIFLVNTIRISYPRQIRTNMLNDPFELPSLEEIKEMDRQRLQAIESLEILDRSVRCQMCGMAVPMVGKLTKPKSNRIAILEKRIKWLENYRHGNNSDNNDDVKQLKQELADLLEEDAKADKLRSLPLYNCRSTVWKFVCSKCYDKVDNILVQRP
jgi:DNA-directed RNA polymerase subunit RPC12/RpoP